MSKGQLTLISWPLWPRWALPHLITIQNMSERFIWRRILLISPCLIWWILLIFDEFYWIKKKMCPDLRQPFWTILLKIHLNSKPIPPRRRNFCSGKKNNFVGEGWWWRTWSAVIIELFKCRNFHRGSREGNSPAVKSSGKSINRVHRSAFVELFFSSSFFTCEISFYIFCLRHIVSYYKQYR